MMQSCAREPETVAALKSASSSPELEGHIASCPACAEAALVSRALARWAARPLEGPPPSPRYLLWKAQIRRGQERAARLDRWCGRLDLSGWLIVASAVVAGMAGLVSPGASGVLWLGLGGIGALSALAAASLGAWMLWDR
jgi:anti-sigma factor RsiW